MAGKTPIIFLLHFIFSVCFGRLLKSSDSFLGIILKRFCAIVNLYFDEIIFDIWDLFIPLFLTKLNSH